jgi:hypothetical protein
MPHVQAKYTQDPTRPNERRLPGLGWLPNRARHMFISCLGEFVGTFLFLFFAFAATQIANNLLGNNPMNLAALLYISLAFGFSLAVNVWIFFRISGGLFNPAVGFHQADSYVYLTNFSSSGNGSPGTYRGCQLAQGSSAHHHPSHRRHLRCGCCSSLVSRAPVCTHNFVGKHFSSSRLVH